jgi:hypothetical protein
VTYRLTADIGIIHMDMDRLVAEERPGRLKRLIFNLFYPAVLGIFFLGLHGFVWAPPGGTL